MQLTPELLATDDFEIFEGDRPRRLYLQDHVALVSSPRDAQSKLLLGDPLLAGCSSTRAVPLVPRTQPAL
jgi:hypothetical protein